MSQTKEDNTGIFSGDANPRKSGVAQVLDFLPFEAVKLFWSFSVIWRSTQTQDGIARVRETVLPLTSGGIA